MYELVLKGGLVVDGTRKKPNQASVCIKGGRIAEITDDEDVLGNEVIDCKGKFISPGFIDLYQHSDACPLNSVEPKSMIHQGITMEIGGNCDISLFPANEASRYEVRKFFARTVEIVPEDESLVVDNMVDYAEIVNNYSFPVNISALIGRGTLRKTVVGFDDREATPVEMEEMQ